MLLAPLPWQDKKKVSTFTVEAEGASFMALMGTQGKV